MKINFALMFLLLSMICTVVSCNPSQVKLDDPVVQTSDSIAATRTRVYLDFLASRPTATPTDIFTPSPSATTVPTLSPKDEDEFIFDMIENNGSCEFPCIWGIHPWATTHEEYLTITSPVYQHLIGDDLLYYPSFGNFKEKDLESHPFPIVSVYPFFTEGNESVVSYIEYKIVASRFEDGSLVVDDEVQNTMRRFALNNILSRFGVPSRVLLRARFADEQSIMVLAYYYDSVIFYEKFGFIILYDGPHLNSWTNKIVRHCFNASNLISIKIISHSPEDGLSLVDLLDLIDKRIYSGNFQNPVRHNIFINVEEATGVNLNDFFDQYRIPNDNCLESPLEIWWPY